jgi:hypothetical protein
MARELQLPVGQLNTAAKPVDAFIAPINYQVAQPGPLVQLPGVQGVNVIGTGGTTNVQGSNSFADLAEALRPFTKELVQATQTAGLAFAKWQMDKGEAEFLQQYRTAQLKVDESTEVGEVNYAQGARAVGAKDPGAGSLMWMLNPYREIGAQRARSRLAGQEIEYGMPSYVNSRSNEIDYTSPDQGFAALNKIRAEYVAQVTEKFGVNESSPGFQKYAAPAIEKASEREAARIQEDRVKYYDEVMPRQLTQLLRNQMILVSMTGASFELDGKTYTRGKDPEELYWIAAGIKLNNISRDFLQKAGPGGMASKWARQAYESLKAEAYYNNDQTLLRLVGQIRSGEPLRGPDGKPTRDAQGQSVYLTWDQLYSQDSIDSRIKYEQAGYAARQNEVKDFGARSEAAIGDAIQGMPPGPDRAAAAAAALDRFIKEETARTGRPPSPVAIQEARRAFKEASDLTSDLVFEQDDPGAPTRYFAQLEQTYGSDFNAKREREKVQALAAGMRNQEEARQFQASAFAAIERKEKEVQDMSGYKAARDKVINDNVNSRILRNYPANPANPAFGKPDREESERRQRGAYTQHVNNRIKEKEAQLKRKLNESEVRAVTQQAIDEYGKNDKDSLQYLFPGSPAYPDSQSVDPYGTIKPVDLGADGKPKPNTPPAPKVYSINQLDDIPNRAVELRQYRTKPVMALNSIRDVIFNAIDGKAQSVKFERAWRDAGAPNAWDFLMKQLKMYPNYKGDDWSPSEEYKARQRLLSMGGTANAEVARAAVGQQFPNIAAIASQTAGRTFDAIFGVAPASAEPRIAIRQGGGGGQGGAVPFTGSGDLRPFNNVLALLRSGEGGWDSANRGIAGDTPRGVPGLSRMTLGQWKGLQARGYNALGAYQFIPGTLKLAQRELGLSDSTVMTPEVQGRLAVQLMVGTKRPRLAAYLKGESNDIGAALDDLALEWASVHTRGGGTAYPTVGGNAASIPRSRAHQVLQQARAAYLGRG